MRTLAERLWNKVDKTTECWLWTAHCSRNGYGRIKVAGVVRDAHRVAWELASGGIPDGLVVMHQCDRPRCVRPEHLSLGTLRDNSLDMVAKGRQRGPRGEAHRWSRLTDKQAIEIRRRHVAGESAKGLAREFGVRPYTVQAIVKRLTRKHLGPA